MARFEAKPISEVIEDINGGFELENLALVDAKYVNASLESCMWAERQAKATQTLFNELENNNNEFKTEVANQVNENTKIANEAKTTADSLAGSIATANENASNALSTANNAKNTADGLKDSIDQANATADKALGVANNSVKKSGDTMTGSLTSPSLTGQNGVFDGNERVYSPNNPPPATGGGTSYLHSILLTCADAAVVDYKAYVSVQIFSKDATPINSESALKTFLQKNAGIEYPAYGAMHTDKSTHWASQKIIYSVFTSSSTSGITIRFSQGGAIGAASSQETSVITVYTVKDTVFSL